MRIKGVLWTLVLPICVQVCANDSLKQRTNQSRVLITTKADHAFSNPYTKDHFLLSVSGKSILDGKISLSISTNDHKIIFRDHFQATDLLWDYDEADLTKKQKEEIIRKRMKYFFNDSSFIKPAIKIASPFGPDNSDKAVWLDIKSNKEAIGFVYSYGYEGTYAIAYSKKKQKAVLYYSSD
jgi:hypothetical protein